MKGIILAGGLGRRLYPITKVISKQLLPVYDKPMLYYPLSTLMSAGIRDILLISTPDDRPKFQELLGRGERFGIHISYAVQSNPDGLVQALLIGERFICHESCAMVLGDNFFYGDRLAQNMREAVETAKIGCATIFCRYVKTPERFGVAELDRDGKVLSVEEKPEHPKSNYCITGLYIYDGSVVEKAKKVHPSPRGELEITDLNRLYLDEGRLRSQILDQSFTWMDTGTVDSLMKAAAIVETIQKRQGVVICAPEEIAYRAGWISRKTLLEAAELHRESFYGEHLRRTAEEGPLYEGPYFKESCP